MITVIGEKGKTFSKQNDFPENATRICGGEGRIVLVAYEGKGGFWPHDAIAVAVYFCKKCLKPIAIFNQG